MTTTRIITVASDKEFVRQGSQLLGEKIRSYTAKSRLRLGLSGGSTPAPVYTALADMQLDWSRIDAFLVDERYVPPDHPDSNQRMIRETLKQNVIAPNTLLPISLAVDVYEKTLAALFNQKRPTLLILGMGDDGHVASLFPGDKAALLEREKLVLHTHTQDFKIYDRITVTLPVLWRADERVFLIAGKKKRELLNRMQRAEMDLLTFPAQEFLGDSTTWITQV